MAKLSSDHALDPETEELLRQLKNPSEPKIGFSGRELTEDEFVFDPSSNKSSSRKVQAILMTGAKFRIEDQRCIYKMFVSKAFPLFYLTRDQFIDIMLKFGWEKSSLADLFRYVFSKIGKRELYPLSHPDRCFKVKTDNGNRNFLSYPEFITGLAACEQLTPHGEFCGEARCRYIFRYYDKNCDGNLDFEEFLNMVKDIRAIRGASLDPEAVKADAESSAKSV